MARKSKEPWLRKTSQSMAASRAPSAPAVLNLRMAVPLRAIFFIARCRSTRTPCLKDRRDGLKIQQTYLWVLIPQIHKNGAFRARPRHRTWPPSSKCIRGRARRSLDDAVNLGKQLRRVAAHSRDGGTMAIYRIFRERVFEPEAVISMAKAYEGVLVALKLTHRQDSITELVAKKIVEIAEMGERDPARLRDRALEEL